jgi:hypothetical protein
MILDITNDIKQIRVLISEPNIKMVVVVLIIIYSKMNTLIYLLEKYPEKSWNLH